MRTNELPFEPPHVHVWFGGEEVRIELEDGTFMDDPPPGKRRAILTAYAKHTEEIWATWTRIHESEGGEDE
ncbi:MAG: DUF4160 domain-containing protein [Dehalococcoidia bacterium]